MNFIFDTPESRAEATSVATKFSEEILSGKKPIAAAALEAASHLLSFSKDEHELNAALAVICHAAERDNLDELETVLLHDCIDASRNYLYLDMLQKRKPESKPELNVLSTFRKSLYTTEHGTTLTKQQKQIIEKFKEHKRLVVSAPTSFGKTMAIQEIILQMKYQQVAIVMPTIALMSETVAKFKANPNFSHFDIINNTSSSSENPHKIFVLTPEKLDLLLEEDKDLKFDFFAMDEIYKIQDDKDRRAVFSSVLYTLITSGADFYLIGPYFKRFSENFLNRTKSAFLRYSTEIVQKEVFNLTEIENGETIRLGNASFTKAKTDATNIKRISQALNDQKIFYYKDTRGVETIAKNISANTKTDPDEKSSELIKYIAESISEKWSLTEYLKKGVAFHHGAMPRHIQSEIVDFFNSEKIHTLVCTTTLTEGVNTTAKNIIILSNEKGTDKLTGFDYKNIKGRAGRFLHHFTGRVINLVEVPEDEKEEILFHYFDSQDLATDEILRIEDKDLTTEHKKTKNLITQELEKAKIPLALVKSNKYIPIEKQLALLSVLRQNPYLIESIHFLGSYPEKEKLSTILQLCHSYLFSQKEHTDKNFPLFELDRLVKFHIYHHPSIKQMIATQSGKSEDTRIRNAFKLIARYFEFSLPKYLTCFSSIFNFAAKEIGKKEISLSWVITLLQYGFESPQAIALKDSGVPSDIIAKLEQSLADCTSLEEIKIRIRLQPKLLESLSDYEVKILHKHI